jgi:hypothetical protein
VPAVDSGPEEDLYYGLELHRPWTWDFLDPVPGGGGDTQMFQQSLKSTGGDQSFRPEGLHLIRILLHLHLLCVAQGGVLLRVFMVSVIVVLLLRWLLLNRQALSRWVLRDQQLDHKRRQLTNGQMTSALVCGAARTGHLSFRKRRV